MLHLVYAGTCDPEAPIAPVPARIRRPRPAAAPEACGADIMWIGASPATAGTLARALAPYGFRIRYTDDVMEARQAARDGRAAAIVVDCEGRPCGASVTLRSLTASEDLDDVPILVASVRDDRANALALGAAEHLTHPLTSERLINVFEGVGLRPCRIEGLNLLVVADGTPETERLAARLRVCRCHVQVSPEPCARVGRLPFAPDLILVDLAGGWARSAWATRLLSVGRAAGDAPLLAVMPADQTPPETTAAGLGFMPRRESADTVGLARQVYGTLLRSAGAAAWRDPGTGLPTRRAMLAYLRGLLDRAEFERRRVTLVLAETTPGAPEPEPEWGPRVQAELLPGEYLSCVGDRRLCLVRYALDPGPTADAEGRLAALVEARLGAAPEAVWSVSFPSAPEHACTQDLVPA